MPEPEERMDVRVAPLDKPPYRFRRDLLWGVDPLLREEAERNVEFPSPVVDSTWTQGAASAIEEK
jgi:hypothetical protein